MCSEFSLKLQLFQKESVVCGRRTGIRKGSGDAALLSPPRGSVVQFNLPGK